MTVTLKCGCEVYIDHTQEYGGCCCGECYYTYWGCDIDGQYSSIEKPCSEHGG